MNRALVLAVSVAALAVAIDALSVARSIAAPTTAAGGAAPPVQIESRQADTVVNVPLLAGVGYAPPDVTITTPVLIGNGG
jgi:hypothetical protein